MEDLLNKEHIASKFIHYLMKSCGSHLLQTNPYIDYSPNFYKKILISLPFQKSEPPINKGWGMVSQRSYYITPNKIYF